MKIQDAVFLIVLLFLIFKKNPMWATIAGLIALVLSIPLFFFWVFFTAERLTWYSAAFFLLTIFLLLRTNKNNDR